MIRRRGSWRAGIAAGLLSGCLAAAPVPAATHCLIVEGIGGTQSYAKRFRQQVESLLEACRRAAGDEGLALALAGRDATSERLGEAFGRLAQRSGADDAFGVFLVGHGTHDGRRYKFNLPGPDVSDTQLKFWLDAVPAARQLVVSATSASGGALETLKAPGRIVITATKNGRERNATVFGQYWAEAVAAPEADQDKNERITALEAFRFAEAKVKAHYTERQQLATEHPQLAGDQASGFVLARLGSAARAAGDPATAALVARREALEREIEELRLRKESLPQELYLDALQTLLLQLADVQEQIDGADPAGPGEGQP